MRIGIGKETKQQKLKYTRINARITMNVVVGRRSSPIHQSITSRIFSSPPPTSLSLFCSFAPHLVPECSRLYSGPNSGTKDPSASTLDP